jgi:polyisoprenoid-binding protein YceI
MFMLRQTFLSSGLSLVLAVVLLANSAQPTQQAVAPASANLIVLTLDPGRCALRWTLGSTLHTVHGTFALKRGVVRLDPITSTVNGEIVADATSGESGNGSRDRRMHNEILESTRYTEVVFRPDGVAGNIPATGSAALRIHGTLSLHGSDHEITVPVQVELENGQWKGRAKFAIPYVQWGLKNPSNFLLKVDAGVDIDLEMTGGLRNSPHS